MVSLLVVRLAQPDTTPTAATGSKTRINLIITPLLQRLVVVIGPSEGHHSGFTSVAAYDPYRKTLRTQQPPNWPYSRWIQRKMEAAVSPQC
jgi:hypothetical protein